MERMERMEGIFIWDGQADGGECARRIIASAKGPFKITLPLKIRDSFGPGADWLERSSYCSNFAINIRRYSTEPLLRLEVFIKV